MYQIGNGDILHFFSTVAYNLEDGKWGSKFLIIMNELYHGVLDKANFETAIEELKNIQTHNWCYLYLKITKKGK